MSFGSLHSAQQLSQFLPHRAEHLKLRKPQSQNTADKGLIQSYLNQCKILDSNKV